MLYLGGVAIMGVAIAIIELFFGLASTPRSPCSVSDQTYVEIVSRISVFAISNSWSASILGPQCDYEGLRKEDSSCIIPLLGTVAAFPTWNC